MWTRQPKAKPPKSQAGLFIAWRKRNKLSQRRAVIVLGCSRMAFMGWERGNQTAPEYIRLAMLAVDHGLHRK